MNKRKVSNPFSQGNKNHPKYEKGGTYKTSGAVVYCSQCQTQFPASLKRCPHCGAGNWYTLNERKKVTGLYGSQKSQPKSKKDKSRMKWHMKQIAIFMCMLFIAILAFAILDPNNSDTGTYDRQKAEQESFVLFNDNDPGSFEEYSSQCREIPYALIMQHSTQYLGEKAKFQGQVVFSQYNGNKAVLCINENNKIVYIKYYRYDEDEPQIELGAILTAYGEIGGLQTYTSTTGTECTVPLLNMMYWTTK